MTVRARVSQADVTRLVKGLRAAKLTPSKIVVVVAARTVTAFVGSDATNDDNAGGWEDDDDFDL